jgi:hypothetical protein
VTSVSPTYAKIIQLVLSLLLKKKETEKRISPLHTQTKDTENETYLSRRYNRMINCTKQLVRMVRTDTPTSSFLLRQCPTSTAEKSHLSNRSSLKIEEKINQRTALESQEFKAVHFSSV